MEKNRMFSWDAKKIANEALFGWLTFTISVVIFATVSTVLTIAQFSEEGSILAPLVIAASFLVVAHGLRHFSAQAISWVNGILSGIFAKRGELLRRFKRLLVLVPEVVHGPAPTTGRRMCVALWLILVVLLVMNITALLGIQQRALLRMNITALLGIQQRALLRLISLFTIFILACEIVIILALINSFRAAGIRPRGLVEFYIDTSRPGWKRAPKGALIWRRERDRDRHRYRTWLVAKVRGGPDWEYGLNGKTQVYIGRRPDNDIVLRDPAADTRQAVIYPEGGHWRINNLSATKSTRVNNRRITKQTLSNGCKIRMGNTELIFRMIGDRIVVEG